MSDSKPEHVGSIPTTGANIDFGSSYVLKWDMKGGNLGNTINWKRRLTWAKKRPSVSCEHCSVQFSRIVPWSRRIFCSKDCQQLRIIADRQLCNERNKEAYREGGRKGGLVSASKNKRRSKDENALYELCLDWSSDTQSNIIIKNGWDSDIVIPSKKLAIAWHGPWHYKEMPLSNHSLKQVQNRDQIKRKLFEADGWTVLEFRDDQYTPLTAFEAIKTLV